MYRTEIEAAQEVGGKASKNESGKISKATRNEVEAA